VLPENLRVALGKHHVDLLGNTAQARADQHAGEVQQHFQVRILGALALHQLRHVGDFRVMEHQQGFTGNPAADKALANGGELVAVAGIHQRHVQLAHFEDIHVRHRQVHEHAQHLGNQCRRTTDGDVDRFAKGIAKADFSRWFRASSQLRLAGGIQQPQPVEGLAQFVLVEGFFQERQRTQLVHPAYGLFLDVTGDHDHLCLQTFGTDRRKHLVAIHFRHGQVEQHHLPQPLADGIHPLSTIAGLGNRDLPVCRQRP